MNECYKVLFANRTELNMFSVGRLVADGITAHVNQSALFMSPLYDASHDGKSRCLRFRYMLQGPGEKALTVYRKAKNIVKYLFGSQKASPGGTGFMARFNSAPFQTFR